MSLLLKAPHLQEGRGDGPGGRSGAGESGESGDGQRTTGRVGSMAEGREVFHRKMSHTHHPGKGGPQRPVDCYLIG